MFILPGDGFWAVGGSLGRCSVGLLWGFEGLGRDVVVGGGDCMAGLVGSRGRAVGGGNWGFTGRTGAGGLAGAGDLEGAVAGGEKELFSGEAGPAESPVSSAERVELARPVGGEGLI